MLHWSLWRKLHSLPHVPQWCKVRCGRHWNWRVHLCAWLHRITLRAVPAGILWSQLPFRALCAMRLAARAAIPLLVLASASARRDSRPHSATSAGLAALGRSASNAPFAVMATAIPDATEQALASAAMASLPHTATSVTSAVSDTSVTAVLRASTVASVMRASGAPVPASAQSTTLVTCARSAPRVTLDPTAASACSAIWTAACARTASPATARVHATLASSTRTEPHSRFAMTAMATARAMASCAPRARAVGSMARAVLAALRTARAPVMRDGWDLCATSVHLAFTAAPACPAPVARTAHAWAVCRVTEGANASPDTLATFASVSATSSA
eukprot:Opistho-2@31056